MTSKMGCWCLPLPKNYQREKDFFVGFPRISHESPLQLPQRGAVPCEHLLTSHSGKDEGHYFFGGFSELGNNFF